MENEKPKETQNTAIVPTTETTVEVMPQPTARFVEKSLEKETP